MIYDGNGDLAVVNKLKIYLAHNYKAREWLRQYVKQLTDIGHTVTARWITDDHHNDPGSAAHNAAEDVEDVMSADVLILFIDQYGDRSGKGKWFEFGLAFAWNMDIILVGSDTSCVFTNLLATNIYRTPDIESAIDLVTRWSVGQKEVYQ